MKIVIAGGTGFVGKALTKHFLTQKHYVYILTRNADKAARDPKLKYVEWMQENSQPEEHVEGADVFINLAGVSLNSGRWKDERKKAIVESRLSSTQEILRIMAALPEKPSLYVNASAVGYYGTSTTETFTEASPSMGTDFLAETVKKWENEALKAMELNIRTVLTRFGVILGKDGGALPSTALPYKLFAGGTVGSGEQWMSWVHLQDVVKIIDYCIHTEQIEGPVNVTAPNPVQMKEFGKTIGKVLNRPHWMPVPSFGLQLLMGEMSMIILKGQRVLPEKLIQQNYIFTYTVLEDALRDLL
ncbi:TIGR01777 family protein [Priestia megaterium]|uniref:TIGR01777 family oxidoreductase n=1 Tax=Priestia megaterium TaxID=1404 RepID=UPI000BFBF961|nr:TIGR01777 family oxidoreductase [Priestia megaterium]MBZ5482174.1 TIGR01777 family oxidoreductase [Bacillus sp. T_4]PGX43325.1 TIGR01777 family protein [Priestia megaterium]UYO25751.1 TIGR01777 family oxidoreductase [Bacillus sp. T_4]